MKLFGKSLRRRRPNDEIETPESIALNAEMNALRAEFDAGFYLDRYDDIRSIEIDPLLHFCSYGWREARNPNAHFSTSYYLRSHPEVANLGINPFLHYLQQGRDRGLKPRVCAPCLEDELAVLRPDFDADLYLQRYPDVAATGEDALAHYCRAGWRQGYDPALGFSTRYYLDKNADIAELEVNPFWHYVVEGRAQGRRGSDGALPSHDQIVYEASVIRPHFDAAYYLNRNPDVADLGYDPVEHYCTMGWLEERDPTPEFSTRFYLQAHQDIAKAEINPFWHYIIKGMNEGRTAVSPESAAMLPEEQVEAGPIESIRPHFDPGFYRSNNPDLDGTEIDPVAHYWDFGWKEGRDPSPYFSTQYYLDSNPDVQAKSDEINPFWHYIVTGQNEGRLPQHPAGYKVEVLRRCEPLEQNVEHWLHKGESPAVLTLRALKAAIGASCAAGQGELILSVGHDQYLQVSGGVQLAIHHEERLAVAQGATYLNLSPFQALPRLAHVAQDPDPIMVLVMNGAELGKAKSSDLIKALAVLRPGLKQCRMVIHHLLGHLPERLVEMAQALGQDSCVLWLHDYFTLCPSYTLQRNDISYCGAPPLTSNACTLCRFGKERRDHLQRIERLFAALKVHVLSPSEVTQQLWLKQTSVKEASIAVVPHMKLTWRKRSAAMPLVETDIITLGFLGTPAAHKGWEVFVALVNKLAATGRYRFVYFGSSSIREANIDVVHVHVTADNPDAMLEAVAQRGCDFVLHWAAWPETFSFSTFEALAGGAYVLTNAISGNVAATVQRLKRGAVLKDQAALLDFFVGGSAAKLVAKIRQNRSEKQASHRLSRMSHELWTKAGKVSTT
jgi:glycosyltransferase involved in cell wall biosynthesis